MSTKKNTAAQGSGASKKAAATKAATPKKKSAGVKTAKRVAPKKVAIFNLATYENLTVSQVREQMERDVRALAIGVGEKAVEYRKHLDEVLYFCFELAQSAVKTIDEADFGQAALSDELDGSEFNELLDELSKRLEDFEVDELKEALRREEVRLAFSIKAVAY